jgi:hypothetical protein
MERIAVRVIHASKQVGGFLRTRRMIMAIHTLESTPQYRRVGGKKLWISYIVKSINKTMLSCDDEFILFILSREK